MRFFLVSLLVFSLFSTPIGAEETCSPESMDSALGNFLKSQTAGREIRLAFLPFQDGSLGERDPTLEKAFPLAFYEILRSQPKIGVIHPLLVFNAVSVSGLTSADLFTDDRAVSAASGLGATHVVFGMFQKKGALLRYFVKIASSESKQTLGQVTEYAAEQSDRFFAVAADTAQNVLKTIGRKGVDSVALKKFLERSPSFEAFRYHVKGMEKSSAFREVDLQVAKVWFEKAAMASYTFKTAYEETARTLLMLALMQKQTGKNFVLLTSEAHQVLERGRLAAGKSKQPPLVDWMVGILEGRINPCGK